MFGDLHLPSLQYWMATAARLQTCQANRHQLPRVSHLWDLAPGRLHLSDCTAPQPHLLIACCWCRASLETRRSNIFAKVLPDKRLLASTCLPTSGKVQLAVALARLRHSLAQLTAMLSRVDSVLSTGKRRQAFKADLFPNLLPGTGFEAPCTRTMKPWCGTVLLLTGTRTSESIVTHNHRAFAKHVARQDPPSALQRRPSKCPCARFGRKHQVSRPGKEATATLGCNSDGHSHHPRKKHSA